jgi:3',5'-cyclic AMP phosphodiesterase CpdA
MGYDPGLNNAWLETQLSSAAAQNAEWRFVWAHKPIYSTGSHGADGSTSEGTSIVNFRSLCDKYNVNIVFSGHDHSYERSKLIRNGQVADSTDNFPATSSGTVYLLTGGGGAPLYSVVVIPPWWRKFGQSVYEYCVIQAGSDSLVMTAKKDDGTLLDRFVWQRNPTAVHAFMVSNTAGNNSPLTVHHGALFFTLVTPDKAFLRLYDVSGKILADYSGNCKTLKAGANSIALGVFSKGVYMAEFGDGKSVSARIVSRIE